MDYGTYLILLLLFLQAIKILDDEMNCDIIKIGGLVRNKVSIFFVIQL